MKEAIIWLAKAAKDLVAGKINLGQNLFDVSAFLSHQAAEKALKALYIARFKRLWKIHDLEKLALSLGADEDILKYCRELTPHYIASRYPLDVKYSKKVSEDALKCSKAIVEWATKKLKK